VTSLKATRPGGTWAWLTLVLLFCASTVEGHGPAPETAPPLFPGGGLISYNSVFTTRGLMPGISGGIPATARPIFSHEADLNFTWGFHTDLDLTVLVPIVTNRFEMPGAATAAGTGLPSSLQPGSGSSDLFLGANWTYTGLFSLRRLVADEDFHALLRSQGTPATRLGDDFESRFWLSYRPYESKNVARERFVGPVLTWLHSQDDRIAGVTQSGSGGGALLAGITSYAGVRPGMHIWFGMDLDFAHSTGATFMPVRRHIRFGITQQFRLHF
jgi:hypothetical protein